MLPLEGEPMRRALGLAVVLWSVLAAGTLPRPAAGTRSVETQPMAYAAADLGTLSAVESRAVAINDLGQVVGAAETADGAQHAFLWQDGAMEDLGTLGGEHSWAWDVNDRGQVVGAAWDARGESRAYLWADGWMDNIGGDAGEESLAVGINAAGRVVGWARRAGGGGYAMLWEGGRSMDLDRAVPQDAGWDPLGIAQAVNDRGQVVGFGDRDGRTRAFRLTPNPTNDPTFADTP